MDFARTYLQDVLGVRNIRGAISSPAAQRLDLEEAKELSENCLILFLSEPRQAKSGLDSGSGLSILELPVFEKMRQAMKLADFESKVMELSPAELALYERQIPECLVVVSFSEKHSHYLKLQRPDLVVINTVHPMSFEGLPQLKKQAWEDLRLAMEKAGILGRLK